MFLFHINFIHPNTKRVLFLFQFFELCTLGTTLLNIMFDKCHDLGLRKFFAPNWLNIMDLSLVTIALILGASEHTGTKEYVQYRMSTMNSLTMKSKYFWIQIWWYQTFLILWKHYWPHWIFFLLHPDHSPYIE